MRCRSFHVDEVRGTELPGVPEDVREHEVELRVRVEQFKVGVIAVGDVARRASARFGEALRLAFRSPKPPS